MMYSKNNGGFFEKRKNKKLAVLAEELEKKLELCEAGEIYFRVGNTQKVLSIAKQLEDSNRLGDAKRLYSSAGYFEKALEMDSKINDLIDSELLACKTTQELAEIEYLAQQLENAGQYRIAGDLYFSAGNKKKSKEMYELENKNAI